MKALRQLAANVRVLRSARRNRTDLLRALVRRPQLLAGTVAFELGLVAAARVDPGLKLLAELKVAAIVACEYCLDIGSALARYRGVMEHQLQDLHRYRESDAFTDAERTVIEYAEVLTRVPAIVPDDLRARLEASFTPAQRAELATTIAWENERSRLNQGLGVRPAGFSDGAYCLVPEADVRGEVRQS